MGRTTDYPECFRMCWKTLIGETVIQPLFLNKLHSVCAFNIWSKEATRGETSRILKCRVTLSCCLETACLEEQSQSWRRANTETDELNNSLCPSTTHCHPDVWVAVDMQTTQATRSSCWDFHWWTQKDEFRKDTWLNEHQLSQICGSLIADNCDLVWVNAPLSFGPVSSSRGRRSSLRGWRRTEAAQPAEQCLVLGRRRDPEPRPARQSSPPAGSARPRKNRRRKTNVLFCNIRRARVSECVVHLLIFEKGDNGFSPWTGQTAHWPHPMTHKGWRERRGRDTDGGSTVPKPLVPDIIYPQWNMDIRGWDTTSTTTTTLSQSWPNFVTCCTVHYICDVGSSLKSETSPSPPFPN